MDDKNTTKKAANPKRLALIAASNALKAKAEETGKTINELLIESYTTDEHQEFALFKTWKERGYRIKKGSKAFIVWGRKRKIERPEAADDEQDGYKFFPMAYLFSNAQVEQQEAPTA